MRLAHLSDLHVLDVTGIRPWRFLNKRITGVANLVSARRSAHSQEILERVVAALDEARVDHVVVTGDLTNLSLESEFARARELLAPIATRQRLSIVPGNHDVYTSGSFRKDRFEEFFGDLLWPDGVPPRGQRYPWFKEVGEVHVVGMCSALPRAPLLATGEVDPAQLERMRVYLDAHLKPGQFAVGLVHHNLHDRSRRKNAMHGMVNRKAVLDACADAGMGLLLHGHTHVANRFSHGDMAVIGCGSSTWNAEDPEHRARFNIYTLDSGSAGGEGPVRLAAIEAWVVDDDEPSGFSRKALSIA